MTIWLYDWVTVCLSLLASLCIMILTINEFHTSCVLFFFRVAITLGSVGDYESNKVRMANGFKFKVRLVSQYVLARFYLRVVVYLKIIYQNREEKRRQKEKLSRILFRVQDGAATVEQVLVQGGVHLKEKHK